MGGRGASSGKGGGGAAPISSAHKQYVDKLKTVPGGAADGYIEALTGKYVTLSGEAFEEINFEAKLNGHKGNSIGGPLGYDGLTSPYGAKPGEFSGKTVNVFVNGIKQESEHTVKLSFKTLPQKPNEKARHYETLVSKNDIKGKHL